MPRVFSTFIRLLVSLSDPRQSDILFPFALKELATAFSPLPHPNQSYQFPAPTLPNSLLAWLTFFLGSFGRLSWKVFFTCSWRVVQDRRWVFFLKSLPPFIVSGKCASTPRFSRLCPPHTIPAFPTKFKLPVSLSFSPPIFGALCLAWLIAIRFCGLFRPPSFPADSPALPLEFIFPWAANAPCDPWPDWCTDKKVPFRAGRDPSMPQARSFLRPFLLNQGALRNETSLSPPTPPPPPPPPPPPTPHSAKIVLTGGPDLVSSIPGMLCLDPPSKNELAS